MSIVILWLQTAGAHAAPRSSGLYPTPRWRLKSQVTQCHAALRRLVLLSPAQIRDAPCAPATPAENLRNQAQERDAGSNTPGRHRIRAAASLQVLPLPRRLQLRCAASSAAPWPEWCCTAHACPASREYRE